MKKEITLLYLLKNDRRSSTGYSGFVDQNCIYEFDPFTEPNSIFHDLFEHNHETDKYFSGQYAFTVWGELVATGKALALADMGVNSMKYAKNYRSYFSYRDYTADTYSIFEDYFAGYEPTYANSKNIYDLLHPYFKKKKEQYTPVSVRTTVSEFEDSLSEHTVKYNYFENCLVYGYNQIKKYFTDSMIDECNKLLDVFEYWRKHNIVSIDSDSYPVFIDYMNSDEDTNIFTLQKIICKIDTSKKKQIQCFLSGEGTTCKIEDCEVYV